MNINISSLVANLNAYTREAKFGPLPAVKEDSLSKEAKIFADAVYPKYGAGKSDLKDFVIENGEILIYYSGSQSYIEIPEGIKVIKARAFSGCQANVIVIPNSVEYIESSAFTSCNAYLLCRGFIKMRWSEDWFCGLNYILNIDKELESKRKDFPANENSDYLDYIIKLSNIGYSEAQYILAELYYYGKGFLKDRRKAFDLYLSSAQSHNAHSMAALAYCYLHGEGVEKDPREAVKWYKKAAEKDDTGAMFNLGWCYSNGEGVEKDPKKAVKWYKKAAEKDDVRAMVNLGWCYINGEGVEKDPRKAVKWYKKAAEKDDADAMYNVGCCYLNGVGVETDQKEAVKWYEKAAEKGQPMAKGTLACISIAYNINNGLSINNAVEMLKEVAEQNSDATQHAQVILYNLYKFGCGKFFEKDENEAAKWRMKLVKAGFDNIDNVNVLKVNIGDADRDIVDVLMDEENRDPIVCTNSCGVQISFEQLAVIPYDDRLYAVLRPSVGIGQDQAVIVYVQESEECEPVLVMVSELQLIVKILDEYYDLSIDAGADARPIEEARAMMHKMIEEN